MRQVIEQVAADAFHEQLVDYVRGQIGAGHVELVVQRPGEGEQVLAAAGPRARGHIRDVPLPGHGEALVLRVTFENWPDAHMAAVREHAARLAPLVRSSLPLLDLARSELLHRTLVEQLPALVYACDERGATIYASPRCAAILGYDWDEWKDNSDQLWEAAIHPDDREWVLRSWEESVAAGRPHSVEYRCIHRAGHVVWVRELESIVRDERGRFICRQGVGFDVTEAVTAGNALRESEAMFRSLVERLPCVVYHLGPDRYVTYANPAAHGLFGYTFEQWRDDSDEVWASRIHPDDRADVVETWEWAMANDASYRIEYRLIAKDGSVAWVDESEQVLRDETGAVLGRQGLMFDITAQKTRTEALAEGERRYRRMVEQAPAVVYVDDPRGRPLYVSPRVEEVFGCTPEQWTGDPDLWAARIHPDDRERVVEAYAQAIQAGSLYVDRYRLLLPDGSLRWVTDMATMLVEEGETTLVEGLLIDVTGQARAELGQLQAANDLQTESIQLLVETLFSLDRVVAAVRDGRLADVDPMAERTADLVRSGTPRLAAAGYCAPAGGNLAAALLTMVRRTADEAGRSFRLENGLRGLPGAVEALVYCVVRDAVDEACRRAGGRAVSVELVEQAGMVLGTVCDDGDALPAVERWPADGDRLMHLAMRVRATGGSMELDVAATGGNELRFAIPIA